VNVLAGPLLRCVFAAAVYLSQTEEKQMKDKVRAQFPNQGIYEDAPTNNVERLANSRATGLFMGWGPKL
jgi:hypothetical protein